MAVAEIEAAQSAFMPADDTLRQLRIAVEEVKNHFNDYVQRQQPLLLPPAEAFVEIGSAFDDMDLPAVRQVTDKVGVLFSQLLVNDVKALSWNLTQALADGLSAIELLLDYLAQQVFDQPLLTQASTNIDKATQLLDDFINNPPDSAQSHATETYASSQYQAHDVVRYDDKGEIAPASDGVAVNAENITENIIENAANATELPSGAEAINDSILPDEPVVEDAELQAARAQLSPDNFEMIDDIGDSFVEETTEIIEDLSDFLPIWEQDTQDLTPLMEVRRSFHALKNSGQMVGAFSISVMAEAIESLLDRLLEETLPATDEMVRLIVETTQHLPLLVADFIAQRPPSLDPALTVLQSNSLLSGKALNQDMHTPASSNPIGISENNADADTIDNNSDSDNLEKDSVENEHFDNDTLENTSSHLEDNQPPVIDSSQPDSSASAAVTEFQFPSVLVPFIDAAAQLPADTQDADPDIKEIFIEEAEEVLAEILPLYERWQQAPEVLTTLTDIRRGFHTLKGSGRMVGANYTGELAWSIENMLNRILDRSITVSTDIVQLVGDVLSAYPELVAVFAEDDSNHSDEQVYPAIVPLWVACAQAYHKNIGDEFSYSVLYEDWIAHSQSQGDGKEAPLSDSRIRTHDPIYDTLINSPDDTDYMLQTIHSMNEIMAGAPVVMPVQSQAEQEFCDVFVDEAQSLLQDINNFVSEHEHQSQIEVSDKIVRAFHTLRAASGSSALAAISDVSATIEKSLEQLQLHDTMMSSQHLQAITQSTALIENYLDAYEQSMHQQSLPINTKVQKSGQDLASLQAMLGESESRSASANSKLGVAQLLECDIDQLLDAERQLRRVLSDLDLDNIQIYVQQQQEQIGRLATQTADSVKFTLILKALASAYSDISEYPKNAHDERVQTALLAGHAQLIGLFDALAGSMSLKVD
jgi:chemosensory pili system protein ChpA (sensor histidine kinase/response regulator)